MTPTLEQEFDTRFGSDCGRIHIGAGEKNIEFSDVKDWIDSNFIPREDVQALFREYKEKYPDADWTDAMGLLAGMNIKPLSKHY